MEDLDETITRKKGKGTLKGKNGKKTMVRLPLAL